MRLLPAVLLLAACPAENTDTAAPGPLMAGVAVREISAPVGIGTVGFGPFDVSSEPSPFADQYPATNRVHGPPQARALVLYRDDGEELVFLRTDTVAVFQHLRQAVLIELEERLGRSLDQQLVWGGTHTHSGPGRIIDREGIWELVADSFFPDHYERLVDDVASTVEDAYADLALAEVATVVSTCAEGHNDRRCEDGLDYENPTMPLVAVQREGTLDAVMLSYAVHGTVLGNDELTLSRDVSGAIEAHVEDRFDSAPVALFFNSWGGDMSPSSPDVAQSGASVQPDGYDRMESVGWVVGDAVQSALLGATFSDDLRMESVVRRVPMDRDAIGYEDGVFEYDWGGLYCQVSEGDDCDPATTIDDLDDYCIPIPEEAALPPQTVVSAGRLGDLAFVVWPGEPTTLLSEEALAVAEELTGTDVMFIGYANDYTGYATQESDWWQGGYEASGTIWGPQQGTYLVGQISNVVEQLVEQRLPLAHEPTLPPVAPFDVGDYTPYEPTPGIDAGTWLVDAESSYAVNGVVELVVAGADPWLGTPLARLLTADGEPVLRPSGHPVDSRGYAFWTEVEPDPSYRDAPEASERTFAWSINMPLLHAVPDAILPELAGGSYVIEVDVPSSTGEVTLTSAAFTVREQPDTGR